MYEWSDRDNVYEWSDRDNVYEWSDRDNVYEWSDIQYSQRHTMINHCDRRITRLSDTDTDIFLVLFNISFVFRVLLAITQNAKESENRLNRASNISASLRRVIRLSQ